jgi:hypothetical protein
MNEELKQFLQDMCNKPTRTSDDMSQLNKKVRDAGFNTLMCGHTEEDTLMALKALGGKTHDLEIKELAGKLWDDISADNFVRPQPAKAPTPRPF